MTFRKVCAKCKIEMFPKQNGIHVVHFLNNTRSQGIDEIIEGDLWECPTCHTQVVVGLAQQSVLGIDIKLPHEPLIKKLEDQNNIIIITR